MACTVAEGDPVKQKVFIRGDYNSPGEDAPQAFPKILMASLKQPEITTGSGRDRLAEWLARPDNPLPARVMVNRIWQWHFGEGIVRTPDTFGKMARASDASGVAQPIGQPVRRERLVNQGDAPSDCAVERVPDVERCRS